ncbi:MAG: DUF1836 domain-containing protein [Eubacteriales bacterium]|nr:DUF1836 domain-containing protein [Eubacteriales bacterium]
MKQETKKMLGASFQGFRMPRYSEIPNVGLYLEQAAKYISGYLAPLGDCAMTSSMISNYVKRGLIASPVKKQYTRDQIAYLFFIAVGKNILSLDGLSNFFRVQQHSYSLEVAYDYFCDQFEATLQFTFENTDTIEDINDNASDEKRLLFTCIAAVVSKVYVEKCLEAIAAGETE